jgi:GxxExxY protein
MEQERDPRTFAIIGAAMEVHRRLGCGFLEAVYQEAMAVELDKRNIPFRREVECSIYYKDKLLKPTYRIDFICYNQVIVELKALTVLSGAEKAQVLNYLKASNIEIGLLLNFGQPPLDVQRCKLIPK